MQKTFSNQSRGPRVEVESQNTRRKQSRESRVEGREPERKPASSRGSKANHEATTDPSPRPSPQGEGCGVWSGHDDCGLRAGVGYQGLPGPSRTFQDLLSTYRRPTGIWEERCRSPGVSEYRGVVE